MNMNTSDSSPPWWEPCCLTQHAHGPSNCTPRLTEGVRLFQKVVYGPVFLLCLALNLTALTMFYRRRSRWTHTHVYMFNLALADCTLVAFLPFRIYDTFLPLENLDVCAVLVVIHFLNMYASILTVTAISVQRFVGVQFPFLARALGSKKQVAAVVCGLIWVIVGAVCVIFREANHPKHRYSCFERNAHPLPLEFLVTLEVVGYIVPLLIMLLCSAQTIWTLLFAYRNTQYRSLRKSVGVILANLGVFVVCFTPIHVAFFLEYSAATSGPLCCSWYNQVHNFYEVSEWIATTNCCLDAVGYYFVAKDFRPKLNPGGVAMQET